MSYFPVVNLSRRICRHACETRARLVLARLSASPRSIAVYVAAVELGLPKGAVGRSAYGASSWKGTLRGVLASCERRRDDDSFDAHIGELARRAA